MITRREFGKYVGGGTLALSIGEISMGLSCESVFQDIANYVPIGLAAFQEVVSLVSPAEAVLLAPIIGIVKASFADLAADITQYINAPAASKATWEDKVKTAINIVIGNIQQFWSDANLPDSGLATTIMGVLQVVLSTLAAFLPLLGGALLPAPRKVTKTIPIIPYTKKDLSSKTVKANINAIFTKGGYPDHQVY